MHTVRMVLTLARIDEKKQHVEELGFRRISSISYVIVRVEWVENVVGRVKWKDGRRIDVIARR